MIYLQHNTNGNFASANGVGDVGMKADLVLSEIGKRIAVRPEQVISFLKSSGVKVSDKDSTNKLVSLVSKNIPKSKKLVILFAEDITASKGKTQEAVVVADSINEFFKSPNAKNQLLKYTKAIKGIAMSADGVSEGAKWGGRAAIGLAVILGIGFVVYKMKN